MDASRNAVATQEELGPRPRDREIVGSAVLITLPSKAERRMGMQIAAKHLQNPAPRLHSSVVSGLSSSSLFFSSRLGSVVDEDDEIGEDATDESFVALTAEVEVEAITTDPSLEPERRLEDASLAMM